MNHSIPKSLVNSSAFMRVVDSTIHFLWASANCSLSSEKYFRSWSPSYAHFSFFFIWSNSCFFIIDHIVQLVKVINTFHLCLVFLHNALMLFLNLSFHWPYLCNLLIFSVLHFCFQLVALCYFLLQHSFCPFNILTPFFIFFIVLEM